MRGRSRKEITLKILELIGVVALSTATVIEATLSSPYGASPSRIRKNIAEIERRRKKQSYEIEKTRKFHDLLYRLRRDGLIEKKNPSRSDAWSLTAKGKKLLAVLKKGGSENLPAKSYEKAASEEFKIITFDVPERHRRKRDWLRDVLNNLGFTMLQKSVWIGKCALPENFLKDLRDIHLLPYVEIFAVTKTGSLKQLHSPNSRS
ncbi:MAG: CRISPR-associated endonuclease Cas2 [bacterium]|nr:CRISPR-associated endonuclease Cas2 [bacterium]